MSWGYTFTRREWFLLTALICTDFANALCASIQAPFYPLEAENKGASATEYGLVFGIYELVAFISCPIFGRYMGQLGAKFVLICGVFVAAITTILFGLLDMVNGHVWFIGVSFLVRILESLGASAAMTASLSIVVMVFQDSFASVFSILEISHGVGYMVGPTVGGYLYAIGGFSFPFSAVGVVLFLVGIQLIFALRIVEDRLDIPKRPAKILSVLKITPVLLDAFSVLVDAMSVGFLAATLEPHLRPLELSSVALGGMFIINGAVYTLVTPLVGMLCSRQYSMRKMIMLGSLITIVSFCCIGPLPFTPLPTTLWMVCLGLVLDGVGMALMFVPAFVDAIQSVVAHGLPDDLSTYAIVSGVYMSSFALGAFIGPAVAGILFDFVGFRQGTLFVIAMHGILYIATLCTLCFEQDPEQLISRTTTPDLKASGQFSASWSHDNDWDARLDGDKSHNLVDASHMCETDALAADSSKRSTSRANYGTLNPRGGVTSESEH